MGFLAYLLLGGLVGWAANHYFVGVSPRSAPLRRLKQPKSILLWTMGYGVLGAAAASYGGQILGLFSSGQMLEWGSAILGAVIFSQGFISIKKLKRMQSKDT